MVGLEIHLIDKYTSNNVNNNEVNNPVIIKMLRSDTGILSTRIVTATASLTFTLILAPIKLAKIKVNKEISCAHNKGEFKAYRNKTSANNENNKMGSRIITITFSSLNRESLTILNRLKSSTP